MITIINTAAPKHPGGWDEDISQNMTGSARRVRESVTWHMITYVLHLRLVAITQPPQIH